MGRKILIICLNSIEKFCSFINSQKTFKVFDREIIPTRKGKLHRLSSLLKGDIFMFGGKLEVTSANVTDELWVFNITARAWSLRKPSLPPPFALEGHTAHVVELPGGDLVMLTFFGYSPIYSYINKVQEYNISESTC